MEDKWTIVIKPRTGWFDFNLKEVIKYKDLIFMFVKRNFTSQYKQTILGPLWFVINPLLTTFISTIVFGNIAGLASDGVPYFLFHLAGSILWSYFSTCVSQTSATFTGNTSIMGKVYFPRITVPISNVIFAAFNSIVIFVMSIITMIVFNIQGIRVLPNLTALLIPVFFIQIALLGLGIGIIISSLTTKYRDLMVLVSFGLQLWMYATPVVYSVSELSDKWKVVVMINPVAPIITNMRYALLGCGSFEGMFWGISWITTIIILFLGVVLFNRVEKTFMDTV